MLSGAGWGGKGGRSSPLLIGFGGGRENRVVCFVPSGGRGDSD